MSRALKRIVILAALAATGVGGFDLGRRPIALPDSILDRLPATIAAWAPGKTQPPAKAASGPVIYYRDPDGEPFYSAEPKKSADGRDWIAVRASEDVRFDDPDPQKEAADASGMRRILYYRNPMGLPDRSPTPKKDSMGMDYIPVYEGEDANDGSVKLSVGRVQRAGVRSEPIVERIITRAVRAPATIQLDERRVSVVTLRFEAYLEKVADVTTGARVRKGERLMRVYAPDILAAGAQFRSVLAQSSNVDYLRGPAVEGARRRLENIGLPIEAIAAIEKTRDVPSAVDWPAPRDGIVLERAAVEGMRAAAGDTLFRLADISVVWALADVAERDIGAVKTGDKVNVTARGAPGRAFEGRVDLIYPQINMATRTGRVRIVLSNPDGALMPNMFADVEVATGAGAPVLAVSDSAVIDSGRRRVVIIDKGDGRFAPREVKTGMRGDGHIEIREGASLGDKVVTSANFLIDAESNLKAALHGFEQGDQSK
ncbi:efflux RND transporter periplasmic adaptor subunit [Terrarubrum flagellatum]|uniref:efflux RND transporter periplasmic adaptor subunit n=1 Tax=Terrirubrum flagellatum TaxID=2895980 RepID=UPI0031452009